MNTNQLGDVGVAHNPSSFAAVDDRVTKPQPDFGQSEPEQSYARMVRRIRSLLQLSVPENSTVVVISKGDEELLDLGTRGAWHFPRAINGKYAGCYPANSAEAIDHLEKLRSQGAGYLLIPSTAFWWLEYYTGFTRHLQQRHRITAYLEDACILYGLMDEQQSHSSS